MRLPGTYDIRADLAPKQPPIGRTIRGCVVARLYVRPVSAELLNGLNPAQVEAVTSEAPTLCILAGAGSGKTRVLTRRIAWRATNNTAMPANVLALTFTRRAAGELRSRLAGLGIRDQVAAGTFHAVAYGALRRLWADRDERPPTLLDRKVGLLSPMLPRRPGASLRPADIASEIEWAKARMVNPSGYEAAAEAAGRKPPLPLDAVAAIYDRYEQEKQRRQLVDFDDVLLRCAVALEHDRHFGAAQRWRFRHLFVDEFQDVNPLQFRLLEAWRDDRPDLCVVGDPNQAIYAWNGADAGYLTGFRQRFVGARVVHLDDNYRSSPQVLAVANAVLGAGSQGVSGAARRLRPNQPDGPVPSVTGHPTDTEEALAVARDLRRARGAGPWSELCVLTRTHAQLVLFEEALRAAAIPYRLRGAGAFLEQAEIREAMTDLRQRSSTPLAAAVADLTELAAATPEIPGSTSDRRGHLEALARLANELLATDPVASVGDFLAWLRSTLRGSDAPGAGAADAVELATIHSAKGLEWDVVYLTGLEQGLMPIGHANTPDARAEERRLLYVAVTRARRELRCSWSERRTFGARTMSRTRSPWLEEVEATIDDLSKGGNGDGWRRVVAEGRARLQAADGGRKRSTAMTGSQADPAVLTALKTWRATTARASGVPAFVVFHDTTLAAMAEALPRDRVALLALPGVGPVKVERYGEALLEVVAAASA